MPLPLPALLRCQLWDPGTGGACPPTPTHSPAHSSPHGHTGHGHPVYTSHPWSSACKEGSGDHMVHKHPKGCSSTSCHFPAAPGQGCAPSTEGSRHLCVLGVQSLGNISGLAATAAPRGPFNPQCSTQDRRTHHRQTGPGRPPASRLSAPAHNLPRNSEQLSPVLPRASGDPPSHCPDSRPAPRPPAQAPAPHSPSTKPQGHPGEAPRGHRGVTSPAASKSKPPAAAPVTWGTGAPIPDTPQLAALHVISQELVQLGR